jgi:aryl-alcohol dehydrogenase-like predicted oxidoreductase
LIGTGELERIVFGCGNIGGLGSSPVLRGKGDSREQGLALLDHARDLGLTHFDTANTYGGGVSETVLGEWLRRQSSAVRSRVHIATKVGNPNGCSPPDRPLSRSQITLHLDASLRRLGLEQIGLYYLHEFDPLTPLDETLEALEHARADGKIAAFGVSNATIGDLKTVLALTGEGALRRVFTHVQNQFNLLAQVDLPELIPLTQTQGLAYVAFSPLAGGLLSGKYRQDRPANSADRIAIAPDYYRHLLTPETFEAIDELRQRAAAHGWTVSGAALRFVLDTPGVDSLIIAPRSIEQFAAYEMSKGPKVRLT